MTMKNFCAFLIGMLFALNSFDVFYTLVSIIRIPCSFEAYIALAVGLGYLFGRSLSRIPGLSIGYSLFVLARVNPSLPYLGARLFGSCGTGVRGAAAELALSCLASGMLGAGLYSLANRRLSCQDSHGLSPE